MTEDTPITDFRPFGEVVQTPVPIPRLMRRHFESPKVAWDLCNSFIVRLSAGIEVALSRLDYYSDRTQSHQEKLKAADDFVKLFGTDVAFHTDFEDYTESILKDAARVAYARDSVDALLTSEVENRDVSMKTVTAAVSPSPEKQPMKGRVRWLRRKSSVWLQAPFAGLGYKKTWSSHSDLRSAAARERRRRDEWMEEQAAADQEEDGYASDSALVSCRRERVRARGRRSCRAVAAAARSRSAEAAPTASSSSSSGGGGYRAGPSTGADAEDEAEDDDTSSAGTPQSRRVTFASDVSSVGGDDSEDGSRRSSSSSSESSGDGVEVELERLKNLVYPSRQTGAPVAGGAEVAGLLLELWAQHARLCDALNAHVQRLAVLTSRSDRRARRLAGPPLDPRAAEQVLRADLRTAMRDAAAELSRGRRALRGHADAVADFGAELARADPGSWWRRRAEDARRPLRARVRRWWRRVVYFWRPSVGGDHPYALVTRYLPR